MENLKGVIPLAGCSLVADPSEELNQLQKQLKRENLIVIRTMHGGKEFYLESQTPEEKSEWYQSISSVISSASANTVCATFSSDDFELEKRRSNSSTGWRGSSGFKKVLKKKLSGKIIEKVNPHFFFSPYSL